MRKYEFEKVKNELDKRLENTKKRLEIYEATLEVANTLKGKEITKRVENAFKEKLSKYEVFYEGNNDYFRQEREIKVYYTENWRDYETIRLYYYDKISGSEYTLENTYINSMKDTIEYIKEYIEKLKKDRKGLAKKVNDFNILMEKIENWQKSNEELNYIMQVEKY